jgi:hypothetical protein
MHDLEAAGEINTYGDEGHEAAVVDILVIHSALNYALTAGMESL